MDILKSSISRKTLSSFLVIVTMTATFAVVSISISIKVLSDQTRNYYDNTIKLLSKQLNDKLLRLENLAVLLGNDPDIMASNQADDNPKILWEYLDTIKKANHYSASAEIRNTINVHMDSKDRIISSTGRFATSSKYNNSDAYLNKGVPNEWVYRKLHNLRNCEGCNDSKHYTEFLSYFYINNTIGVSIDVEQSDIRRYINNIDLTGDGVVFLVNSEGRPIFSTETFDVNFSDIYSKIQSDTKENGQFVIGKGSSKNRIIYTHSTNTPMLVGTFFNENQIVSPINNIRTLLYVSIAFTLVMSVIFTIISNKNIFRPLYILVSAMKNVKDGNLNVNNNNSTLTDQEVIDLNLIVSQSISDSGSYGIHNTLQRIKLFFDETANIGQIPNLEKLKATIRSREILPCFAGTEPVKSTLQGQLRYRYRQLRQHDFLRWQGKTHPQGFNRNLGQGNH